MCEYSGGDKTQAGLQVALLPKNCQPSPPRFLELPRRVQLNLQLNGRREGYSARNTTPLPISAWLMACAFALMRAGMDKAKMVRKRYIAERTRPCIIRQPPMLLARESLDSHRLR